MVIGDLAKGCIGIANQDVFDVCKMLTRDELTRELDRYNGTKLKRIYKLIKQDMLQMYKVCACFELFEMGMDLQVWMGVIGDRWIGVYLDGVESLSENGILCVHVIGYLLWHIIQGGIWYKLGYK